MPGGLMWAGTDRRFRSSVISEVLEEEGDATVSAQTADRRTIFTFNGPVTLPGVTLPAGQYLFRLADPGKWCTC